MTQSLLSQYDEIVAFVVRYEEWARRERNRLARPFSSTYWKTMRQIPRIFRETDPLRVRRPPFWIELGTAVPMPDDGDERLFHRILFGEYPQEELGSALRTRFPDVDFAVVAKFHKARSTQLFRLNPKAIIGVVVGLGTLVLKNVPKVVVEPVFNYDKFQVVTFWATVILVGYLTFIFMPMWIKDSNAKFRYERVSDILEYVALVSPPKV